MIKAATYDFNDVEKNGSSDHLLTFFSPKIARHFGLLTVFIGLRVVFIGV